MAPASDSGPEPDEQKSNFEFRLSRFPMPSKSRRGAITSRKYCIDGGRQKSKLFEHLTSPLCFRRFQSYSGTCNKYLVSNGNDDRFNAAHHSEKLWVYENSLFLFQKDVECVNISADVRKRTSTGWLQ